MSARWADGWRMAVGTLTAVPVRPPTRIDRDVAGLAMLLAPIATLPLALAPVLAALAVSRAGLPALLAAALCLVALALATRGLHLDGLADTADGVAASFDRDRALAVMRTGDVGPTGVASVVLVLLVQAAALSSLLASPAGALLATVAVLGSRHTLTWLCTPWLPSARPEGLGATVAGSVRGGAALAALGVLAAVCWMLGVATGGAGARVALPLFVAVAAAVALGAHARRRLGGITGDVLGAGVEIGLAAGLTVATLLP